MALQTAALLILAQNYAGDIVRQINRRSQTLALLRKVPGEGKNIAWAAESDGANAEAFAEGADASNFAADAQGSAIIPWALYRSNFSVSDFARSAARSSRTPEGNIDLIARDISNGAATLSSLINVDLFVGASGQTPGEIVGFDEAIGLTNNTYATIDRSSAAYWRPYVVDPGSATALTQAQIRTDLSTIMKAGGVKPNLAIVGPDTLNAIRSTFDGQVIYDLLNVQTYDGEIKLNAGTGGLRFDGCQFVEDKDATEGKIYYINTDVVEVQYLPFDMPGMGGADEQMESDLTDGVEAIPFGMKIEALARTGAADKVMMQVQPQLCVRRPNQCGVRKNVKYS